MKPKWKHIAEGYWWCSLGVSAVWERDRKWHGYGPNDVVMETPGHKSLEAAMKWAERRIKRK